MKLKLRTIKHYKAYEKLLKTGVLITRCEYNKLILWTAEPLNDARIYYKKIGFIMTEKKENNTWQADGTKIWEEKWELNL